MDAVDLLQQLGLNKYEADAYYTLLAEGPLTGYELGKRSQVPLSRSYEILERLTHRGLALQQPGDPPRYAAEEYARVLGAMRGTITQTLDALAAMLATLPRHDASGEFWVLRGRRNILARLRALIGEARHTLSLSLPTAYLPQLAEALSAAPTGRRLASPPAGAQGTEEIVLALADGRAALAGTLSPETRCQAIGGANPALLALVHRHFDAPTADPLPHPAGAPPSSWLDWEARKQRRLWRLSTHTRSA